MKVICAWCNKDMGEKGGKDVEEISHGVCAECLTRLLAETENEISAGGGEERRDERS